MFVYQDTLGPAVSDHILNLELISPGNLIECVNFSRAKVKSQPIEEIQSVGEGGGAGECLFTINWFLKSKKPITNYSFTFKIFYLSLDIQ